MLQAIKNGLLLFILAIQWNSVWCSNVDTIQLKLNSRVWHPESHTENVQNLKEICRKLIDSFAYLMHWYPEKKSEIVTRFALQPVQLRLLLFSGLRAEQWYVPIRNDHIPTIWFPCKDWVLETQENASYPVTSAKLSLHANTIEFKVKSRTRWKYQKSNVVLYNRTYFYSYLNTNQLKPNSPEIHANNYPMILLFTEYMKLIQLDTKEVDTLFGLYKVAVRETRIQIWIIPSSPDSVSNSNYQISMTKPDTFYKWLIEHLQKMVDKISPILTNYAEILQLDEGRTRHLNIIVNPRNVQFKVDTIAVPA
eukprot:47629_1